MDLYENLAQTSNEFDVQSGTCQSISIDSLPDSRIQNVDHVSVDAEIFWSEPFDKCNITVHEVPGCVDPPVIQKEIRHRVGVSECAQRRFSPFDQVWVKLDCEEVGGPHPVAHYFRPVAGNGTVGHGPLNGTATAHSPHNLISHSRTMQKVSRRRLAKLPVA